jgi:hypothetical protein
LDEETESNDRSEIRQPQNWDRVQAGTRTGVIEFVVSDVFLVKWDGRREIDAYTREAFEKQFVPCNTKASSARARGSSERVLS